MSDNTITINGKSFELSPLKLKHLKEIASLVGKPTPTSIVTSLARWTPYLVYSIQVKAPDFKPEELDEATLMELNASTDVLLAVSGIVIKNVTKGEPTPTVPSTGQESTVGSQPPAIIPIET